tara:strand:- start:235 stop:498 length:264 start_codon:yes stop_codon:yes gene_type:complete
MIVGDLIVLKDRKGKIQGKDIRVIIGFGTKQYDYFCGAIDDRDGGYRRSIIYFLNGGWGWKDRWRKLESWDCDDSNILNILIPDDKI